jgi:hypothetical protein
MKIHLKSLFSKPWLLSDKILTYFPYKLAHHSRLRTDVFGWLQAILYSWRIDQWQRYAATAQQIKALTMQSIHVLYVGGANDMIRGFLDTSHYSLCVLAINFEALKGISDSRLAVIGDDGCRLPFKDNSFDIVVSIDSLEHIPDPKKPDYCRELKR